MARRYFEGQSPSNYRLCRHYSSGLFCYCYGCRRTLYYYHLCNRVYHLTSDDTDDNNNHCYVIILFYSGRNDGAGGDDTGVTVSTNSQHGATAQQRLRRRQRRAPLPVRTSAYVVVSRRVACPPPRAFHIDALHSTAHWIPLLHPTGSHTPSSLVVFRRQPPPIAALVYIIIIIIIPNPHAAARPAAVSSRGTYNILFIVFRRNIFSSH